MTEGDRDTGAIGVDASLKAVREAVSSGAEQLQRKGAEIGYLISDLRSDKARAGTIDGTDRVPIS